MRRIAIFVGVVALFVTAATSHTVAATENVSAVDNSFSPQTVTIAPGDTVHWTNDGDNPHTVTADDDSFDSGTFVSGQSYDRTFPNAGTYPYHCTIHGSSMSGTVVVQSVSSSNPPSTNGGGNTTGNTGSVVGGDTLAETGAPLEGWMVIAVALLAWGSVLERTTRRRQRG